MTRPLDQQRAAMPNRIMRRALFPSLILCLLLAACGRPLTGNERAFLDTLHGSSLDTDRVRLTGTLMDNPRLFTRKVRPRVTCTERVYPAPRTGRVLISTGAMAGFRTVWFREDLWRDDFLPDWPQRIHLWDAMLFAHEITHLWQWQNRATTGYHPLKAAFEHVAKADPYLFDPESRAEFHSFGYEQQAIIVEEYVCCRALAPDAPRTSRLHDTLAAVMPVAPLQSLAHPDVLIPWDGVQVAGICD
jgi:hypothetical protein